MRARSFRAVAGAIVAVGAASVFAPSVGHAQVVIADASPAEAWPGGRATTTMSRTHADAFSQPSANMPFARELDFKVGNGLFRKLWVAAPASTKSSDGLGPLFNARACQSCHLKDGRGSPAATADADRALSILLRLSVPPTNEEERRALASGRISALPEPTYGLQLQESAIAGHRAEGRVRLSYRDRLVTFADGQTVSLRQPVVTITELGYGAMSKDVRTSLRLTPQMIGLGLLEAIDERDIVAQEDPDDRDGDGISGRANRVWSPSNNAVALGRFGWKAGQATILDQTADAFANDIGIGTTLLPKGYGDCTPRQTMCRQAVHGGTPQEPHVEINRSLLDLVAFYTRNLAVPARQSSPSRQVSDGRAVFHHVGCASCHTPRYVTGDESADEHLRRQEIWPYTDLLLHDMGDDLADGRDEGRASGREWRTPPLWGIGLAATINGNAFFLHDGRARSLLEAILWHGGEARSSRDRFMALKRAERDALIAFLNAL